MDAYADDGQFILANDLDVRFFVPGGSVRWYAYTFTLSQSVDRGVTLTGENESLQCLNSNRGVRSLVLVVHTSLPSRCIGLSAEIFLKSAPYPHPGPVNTPNLQCFRGLMPDYGTNTENFGEVQLIKDAGTSLRDLNVVVVEDIVDTGLTAAYLLSNLGFREPASLKLCALLSKPSRREVEVPDEFVVGYGLDFGEEYRNLPFIAALKPTNRR